MEAPVLQVESAVQVTARRGGRGRGGGASRGRGARGSGGAGEAANEEDSRPRARHRDAERDLAKIHALRNRRTVVTECVGSPDSTHSLTLDCVVLRGVGWVCCRTNTLCLCLCLCQCLSLSLYLSLPPSSVQSMLPWSRCGLHPGKRSAPFAEGVRDLAAEIL